MNVESESKTPSLASYGCLIFALVSNFAFQAWVYFGFAQSLIWLDMANPDSIQPKFQMCVVGSVLFASIAVVAVSSMIRSIALTKLRTFVCLIAFAMIIFASTITTGRVYKLWTDLSDDELIALPS